MNAFDRGAARHPYLLAALVWLGAAAGAQAQGVGANCSLTLEQSGAGPHDYRTERQGLAVVERRHFTGRVEALISGESTKTPGPDIDYTLAKYPNHHRALLSLVRLAAKLKTPQVPDMPFSVACYFERAVRFRPNDTVARIIYAGYLGSTGQRDAATAQLERAADLSQGNPLTHYNIGMAYLEFKNLDQAVVHAQMAYGQGVTLPYLRDRLRAAGRWTDTDTSTAQAPTAPASAGASEPVQ